jgi:hypothetical protein
MSKAAQYYYAAIQMAADNHRIVEQNRIAEKDRKIIQDAADATQKDLADRKKVILDETTANRPSSLDNLIKDIQSGKSTATDASQQFEDLLAKSGLTATPEERAKLTETGRATTTAKNRITASTTFRDLLGREPESKDTDYFAGLLDKGFTKPDLEKDIQSYPEYKNKLRSPTELGYEARLGPGDKGVYSYKDPYTGKTISGSVTEIDDGRTKTANDEAYSKTSGLKTLEASLAQERIKAQGEIDYRLGQQAGDFALATGKQAGDFANQRIGLQGDVDSRLVAQRGAIEKALSGLQTDRELQVGAQQIEGSSRLGAQRGAIEKELSGLQTDRELKTGAQRGLFERELSGLQTDRELKTGEQRGNIAKEQLRLQTDSESRLLRQRGESALFEGLLGAFNF